MASIFVYSLFVFKFVTESCHHHMWETNHEIIYVIIVGSVIKSQHQVKFERLAHFGRLNLKLETLWIVNQAINRNWLACNSNDAEGHLKGMCGYKTQLIVDSILGPEFLTGPSSTPLLLLNNFVPLRLCSEQSANYTL